MLAEGFARENGGLYVSPGRPGPLIEGHRPIFAEITRALPDVTTVYVPSGGGGLLSAGISECLASGGPRPTLIGVQAVASQPLVDLFEGRESHGNANHVSYAECLAGDLEHGAAILDSISSAGGVIAVTRAELRAASRLVRLATGIRPEPGAAAGVAAAMRHRSNSVEVAILTGAAHGGRALARQ